MKLEVSNQSLIGNDGFKGTQTYHLYRVILKCMKTERVATHYILTFSEDDAINQARCHATMSIYNYPNLGEDPVIAVAERVPFGIGGYGRREF